jgi:hypothetical protein
MEHIDYRELLKKYIAHIKAVESIDYIDHIGDGWTQNVGISEEELAELTKLSEETNQS